LASWRVCHWRNCFSNLLIQISISWRINPRGLQ